MAIKRVCSLCGAVTMGYGEAFLHMQDFEEKNENIVIHLGKEYPVGQKIKMVGVYV